MAFRGNVGYEYQIIVITKVSAYMAVMEQVILGNRITFSLMALQA